MAEKNDYVNRELSWIEFNYRVLSEARDKSTPLFDRLKFLSITASNLDEFYMVRVASLKDMVHAKYAKKDIAGLKEPIDYTALCKLAADFSDGIIQQSEHVNEEVLNYARESGKPVLEYQSPENFAEACNDFYDKVWETEQK